MSHKRGGLFFLCYLWFDGINTTVGGSNGKNYAIRVEAEVVYAYLTVEAGVHLTVEIGGVNTVVDNVPIVVTRYTDNAVVRRAIDVLLGQLLQDDGMRCEVNGTERGVGGTVGDVVVG